MPTRDAICWTNWYSALISQILTPKSYHILLCQELHLGGATYLPTIELLVPMTGTLQIQDIIVRQINRLGLSSPAAHIEQMRYELLQINLMKLEVRVIVLMIIKLHYYHGSWQCLKRLKHTPTPFLESESKHCYLLHPSWRSYQSHSTLHFTA
jgi:hypothetical protein